ncbi:hypothetical protein D8674_028646 [Pyrus ussuriensis x Pyrus communis]|uniref:Uncharacterized protein n=1 Tax=Pyrus ussuriensis x Pyrus communis TaxID=2448454 RepID=A0A5N5HXS1_9ROSA|nr:hypothetical protein D8674_028646 [Pyrus ussuriensis x Pyrus communis]
MWVGQQALKAAHEVETYQYVNATALKDLKAKDYQEDLMRARDVLRLKRQAKIYDDIKRMDFPPPQHLLDEISDLEVEQEEFDSNVIRPLMLLKSLPSSIKGNKSQREISF